jgi:hypothetical protein
MDLDTVMESSACSFRVKRLYKNLSISEHPWGPKLVSAAEELHGYLPLFQHIYECEGGLVCAGLVIDT